MSKTQLQRRAWLRGAGACSAIAACPWLAGCGPGPDDDAVSLSVRASAGNLALAAGERGRVAIDVELFGRHDYNVVTLSASTTASGVTLGFEPGPTAQLQVSANNTARAMLVVDVAQESRPGTVVLRVNGAGPYATAAADEILLTITGAAPPLATHWQSLPQPGVAASPVTGLLGLGALGNGQPVLAAYVQGPRGRTLQLRRHDGSAWADWLPGADNSGPPAPAGGGVLIDAAFAIGPDEHPVFARVDRGGGDTLAVWRHDGTAWVALGAALNMRPGAASTISRIDMALDAAGHPVLAFSENRQGSGVDFDAYLKRWDGSQWLLLPGRLGNAINGAGLSVNDLALALAANGDPHVVLSSYAGSRSLREFAYDQSGWRGSNEVNPPGADAVFADIAVDRDGASLVAWVQTRPGANDLFLTRVSRAGVLGTLADPALGRATLNFEAGSTVLGPRLGVDRLGRVVLVWGERPVGGGLDDLRARRLDGTSWAALGEHVETSALLTRNPQLVFDADAEPVVAWNEAVDLGGSASTVQLARWTP